MKTRNKKHKDIPDVIIIGGGPIGIYLAIELRKKNLKVLVIEKDRTIGEPRFCSGLISRETYRKFALPENLIQNKLNSAWIISPSEKRIYLKNADMEIFVVDRAKLDHVLYKKAESMGVEFLLDHNCVDIWVADDYVEADVTHSFGKELMRKKASLCVLATGVNYSLHGKLALGTPPKFLNCTQIEIPCKNFSEIEIYVGNTIAPHSFAWVIPVNADSVRIGVSTYGNSREYLRNFITSGVMRKLIRVTKIKDEEMITRPIPLGTIGKSYSDRVIAVGDAAGQTKPITGGGLYFGILCADIAVDIIEKTFIRNAFSARFLKNYEKKWKKSVGFDIDMGFKMRRLFSHLSDGQIDLLFDFFNQKEMRGIINRHANFDRHLELINIFIKKPLFWDTVYKVLSHKGESADLTMADFSPVNDNPFNFKEIHK